MFRAVILVILTSTPVWAQSLTPTEVESAVAAGSAGASPRLSCIARGAAGGLFSGSFTVNVEGPMGHVMRMAAEAKRKYKPFAVADVTEEMLAPAIPEGDVEVVIVTEGGERRCTLPVKQRATFR